MGDLIEGQVFFQVIAGMMADMSDPRVPPNPIHEESLAQLTLCANNINAMFTWNPEGGGAVVFPSWKVHIGAYGNVGSYLAPNGFCYVNACLDEFVSHATSGGGMHMGLLVSSPNMGRHKGDKGCGRAYAACLEAPTRTPPQCTMPACGWDGKEWTQAARVTRATSRLGTKDPREQRRGAGPKPGGLPVAEPRPLPLGHSLNWRSSLRPRYTSSWSSSTTSRR